MAPEHVEYIAYSVLVSIYCLLIAIGIILNSFIVIVKLNCWKKCQPLQAIDLIITSLAMVRLILLFCYTLPIIEELSGQLVIKVGMYPEYIYTSLLSVEFCSVWWGSALCVFYCVKITNYKNRLFMKLKMKISKMVPWLLIFSLVPSILFSLPYKWVVFSIQFFNGTDGQTGGIKINWLNYLIIFFAGSIIPFVIVCTSVVLLTVSLLRHTRNLGSRGSGFSDAQRDVHLSVIRNMVSFLLFYILYFLGSNLVFLGFNYEKKSLVKLCSIFCSAVHSLHSISIIVSNRELKNSFLTVLRCLWKATKLLAWTAVR